MRYVVQLTLVALVTIGCEFGPVPSVELASLPGASPTPTRSGPPAPEATGSAPPSGDFMAAAARGPWRPAPLVPIGDLLGHFEATCVAADPRITGHPAAVRDVRGEGHVTVIFGEANVDDPSFLCRGLVDSTTAAELEVLALNAGRDPIRDDAVDIVRYETLTAPSGGSRTILVGRVGRLAAKVNAIFPDASEVEATHGGGWYAMWWPGSEGADTIAAVDRRSLAIGGIEPPGPPARP